MASGTVRDESGPQYRSLFDNAADGIMIVDNDGRILKANRVARERLGYREDEFLRLRLQDIDSPEMTRLVPERIETVKAKGVAVFESEHMTRGGRRIPVEISCRAIEYRGQPALLSVVRDITERKNAEELIRIQRDVALALASTSDLRAAMDLLLEAACHIPDLDCGGVYVSRNDGRFEMFAHRGLTEAFVHQVRVLEEDSSLVRNARSGRTIYGLYGDLRPADPVRDREGLLAVIVVPILHNGGLVATMHVASHTATEFAEVTRRGVEAIAAVAGSTLARIRAETALAENERDLQTFFDTIDDLLFVLDEKGRILRTNPAVERQLGYSAGELRGMHILDLHPPSRRQEAAEVVAGILEHRAGNSPIPLQTRSGRQIPVETNATVGKLGGRTVIFEVSRDRSEVLRAEERATQFGRMLEYSLNEIFVFDAETLRFSLVNRGARENLGYSAAELEQLTPLGIMVEMRAEELEKLLAPLRERASESVRVETVHRRKNGTSYPAEVFFQQSELGDRPCMVAVVNDITERQRTERELRQFAETQATLLKEVNHRVKNNLAAILSIVQKEEDRARALGLFPILHILSDVAARLRALALVHQLLSGSGWKPLPLTVLCEGILRNTFKTAGGHLKTEVRVSSSPGMVSSNEAHQLALVLNELAINTLKHAAGAIDRVRAEVVISTSGREHSIRFTDNGPGFPPELLAGTERSGTGLDLIRGIVRKSLRGSLSLANDGGATATITFRTELVSAEGEV